jgi:hypothetical protein
MKSAILIVEGDLDYEFFSAIVPSGVMVERSTGKFNIATYVEIVRKRLGNFEGAWSIVKPDIVFGFRDRDFDSPFQLEDPVELTPKGNVHVCFRRTIENYLLTFKSISGFLETIPSDHKLSSLKGRGPAILREAAEDIKYYQAARCALGEIRRANLLRSTWLADSDKLPNELAKEACRSESLNYLASYRAEALNIGDAAEFEMRYEKFLTSFDQPFWEKGKYEWYFQGKNLAKAITRKYPNFPMNSLFDWAIRNINLDDFPDIFDLVQKLKTVTQ